MGDSALALAADWLVLQGPAAPIFEGDPLVLRCQAWQGWPLAQVTFYRDGSALGAPGPNREFSIAVVQEADSGHYHCSAIFRSPGPGSPETASSVAVMVTVQGEGSGRSRRGRAGGTDKPPHGGGGGQADAAAPRPSESWGLSIPASCSMPRH